LIGQRTALVNALRGHFAELGIVESRYQRLMQSSPLSVAACDDGDRGCDIVFIVPITIVAHRHRRIADDAPV
jgi:hypothetical protein